MQTLMGVLVLDPEKLLWVPGQKVITYPKRDVFYGGLDMMGGWKMGDVIYAAMGVPGFMGMLGEGEDPKYKKVKFRLVTQPSDPLKWIKPNGMPETSRIAIMEVVPMSTPYTTRGYSSLSTVEEYRKAHEEYNPLPNQFRNTNARTIDV